MAGNKLARRIILKCLPFAIITSLTSTVTYYNNMMIASVTIGQEAVQAISSESLYTLFLSVIASMLATGGAVAFIGYRYRRKPKASESFTLSLLSGTVFGFVFMVVCQLMTPIGVEQDAVTLADEYIRAIGLSAIPVFLLQIVNAHLWVDEDCWMTPLCFAVFIISDSALAFNLWEDYSLFGIEISMGLGAIIALCVSLLHLRKKNRLMRLVSDRNLKKRHLKHLLKMGFRTVINRISMNVRYGFLKAFILYTGSVSMMCISAQSSVLHLVVGLYSGCAIVCLILCKWAYSEKDRSGLIDSLKEVLRVGVFFSVIVMIVILVFSEPLTEMLAKDYDDFQSSLECLRWFALSVPTTTYCMCLIYAYQSTGRLLYSSFITVVRGVILMAALVILLWPLLGAASIWVSFLLCDLVMIALVFLVAIIHNKKFPADFSELLMIDENIRSMCEETVESTDMGAFLDGLEDRLVSDGMKKDAAEKVAGYLRSIYGSSGGSDPFTAGIVVDCKESASVVTLDDSKDIADISEGTVHTNIVGLNIYSATFPL